jgi:hypothetical protein
VESKNHLKRGVINSIIGGFIISVNDSIERNLGCGSVSVTKNDAYERFLND